MMVDAYSWIRIEPYLLTRNTDVFLRLCDNAVNICSSFWRVIYFELLLERLFFDLILQPING